MTHRTGLALAAAGLLVAPAALILAADALQAATGVQADRLVNAVFAALGVTGTSPLPLRQTWYAGVFILAPLAGAAVALSACIGADAHARRQLAALCTGATLLASFWAIRSLLDD